ncbi:MAG: hypothetical protein Q7U91_15040 [Sideroxyarcus sp.]|nr:hypothetical protein [Sideroxyarcus sp.]
MRKVLLFPLLWAVLVNSACAEVDLGSTEKPVDATSTDGVRTIPAVSKWYAGGAIGFADVYDWWYPRSDVVDDYYQSVGYYHTGGSSWPLMREEKLYFAYRMREYMDVEFGYSQSDMKTAETYTSGVNTVWSKRDITFHALYVSALLRPEEGYGHKFYLKLGGHISQSVISKSVTGNAPNLVAIAAGDRLPEDGTSSGVGGLMGIGVDIRTGKVGAIRLELNRLYRVGGTSICKDAFNLGYQFNFE